MAIINNRKKIASEVPSALYKENWDAIFGKHKNTLAKEIEKKKEMEALLEDEDQKDKE